MRTLPQIRDERNSLSGGQVNIKLTAALEYAAQGWPVFPIYEAIGDHCSCGNEECGNPGKHPRTKHGLNDATTDANQIRAWWTRWPNANVAVAPKDFFVLDNDPRHGGDKTLAALIAEHGTFPETLRATSGGGGEHYPFNMPPGVEIRNVEGEDWGQPGLDIRGKGGYFLVEPSNHVSGTYRWVNAGTPIADAPVWLVQLYLAHKAGKGGKPGETRQHDAPAADRIETSEEKRHHGEHWLGEALKKAVPGNRNDTGLWLACQLRDDGLSEQEAEPFMKDYAQRVPEGDHLYTEDHALASLKSAFTQAKRPPAQSLTPKAATSKNKGTQKATNQDKATRKGKGTDAARSKRTRTLVVTNDRSLDETTDEALAALVAANQAKPKIFVRGGVLCRVRRIDGQLIIEPLTGPMLKHSLAQRVLFVHRTKVKDTIIAPPENVVKGIMDLGEWNFPPLLAITGTPPVRQDGTICTEHGYDADTGLYYAPHGLRDLPAIPEYPTADDVAAARAVIDDLLYDFPFADDGSYANCYALLLTPLWRAAIEGAVPMGLLDAPSAGSGKGLLADVVGLIATGHNMPLQAAPQEAEEWRKTITSALMNGNQFFCLDNLNHALSSGVLAQAITALIWEDRLLGTNKKLHLLVRLVWMATGNNIQLGGHDMPRRCYWIRINAEMSQPWLREEVYDFRHPNLRKYVREHRSRILHALLTLVRAWYRGWVP